MDAHKLQLAAFMASTVAARNETSGETHIQCQSASAPVWKLMDVESTLSLEKGTSARPEGALDTFPRLCNLST